MKPIIPLLFSCVCMIALSSCNDPASKASTDTTTANSKGWPRTIQTVKGSVTLKQQPQRIVSTSVTLTGSLLTINAPLIGSSTTKHLNAVTDEHGFFRQWGSIAKERKVQPLYQGEINIEAVLSAAPDLIIVSATGGDSAIKAYEQLTQIAPTIVLNYDDKSWEELATILGYATGHEMEAKKAIESFDKQLAMTKVSLHLPTQPVSAMVYYEDNSGANIWTKDSAQGRLLTRLGFALATLPKDISDQANLLGRKDIVPVSGERFSETLTGQTFMLFASDETTANKVRHNKFLAKHPAVIANRVYALGSESFRLDYYSATQLLKRMAQLFSGTTTSSPPSEPANEIGS